MNGKLYVNGSFECAVREINIDKDKCTFKPDKFSTDWVKQKMSLEFEGGRRCGFVFENLSSHDLEPAIVSGYITK